MVSMVSMVVMVCQARSSSGVASRRSGRRKMVVLAERMILAGVCQSWFLRRLGMVHRV